MYQCPNIDCTIHQKGKYFPALMDCPLCDTTLVREQSYSTFQQHVLDEFPYVIAYPFKQMLEEPIGRNQLELLTYTLANVLKYLGLITASEYFSSNIKNAHLNDLFRSNLYQPSMGNWNHFIREAIEELKKQSFQWTFPELVIAYETVETGKKVNLYNTQSEYTDEQEKIQWRDSRGTSIGTLINFRNKYLAHGVPISNSDCKELYTHYCPILEDLLHGISEVAKIPMYKGERVGMFSLMSITIHQITGLSLPKLAHMGQIWIQKEERQLNLLPFYVLPGSFANTVGKSEVLVYEQNTGSRVVFFSPESIRAESQGEVLERLNLLINDKEKVHPLTKDLLNLETINQLIELYNQKIRNGLIKEKKLIEGIYQPRERAEQELKGWVGAQAGLLVISAKAGSGKTNLLAHMQTVYKDRNVSALLIRAERIQSANLEEVCLQMLHLAEDITMADVLKYYTQSNPLVLLIDGGNEHPQSIHFFESIINLLKKHHGGALKIVLTWMATSLSDLPVLNQMKEILYPGISNDEQENLPAKHALTLTTLDRKELEQAWNSYAAHSSKKYNPQFSLSELTIIDRPLTDQLSNPLLLRMFLEQFNNKSIKRKGKGFTDIWELWWRRISENKREALFLKELALFMVQKNCTQVKLDEIYDHPVLGKDVQNIQVDSPYQLLINKGVFTQYFLNNELLVSFTREAAYHYSLCQHLVENKTDENTIVKLLLSEQAWSEPIKHYLIHLVKLGKANVLYELIDNDEIDTNLLAAPLSEAIITFDISVVLDELLKNPSKRDWSVLAQAINIINEAQQKIKLKEIASHIFKKAVRASEGLELMVTLFEYLDVEEKNKYLLALKSLSDNDDDNLLHMFARFYLQIAKYDEALKYYARCLKHRGKRYSKDGSALATIYSEMGIVYSNLGLFIKALEYYEKSLKINLKSLQTNDLKVAADNNNIGNIYKDMGEYEKALKYLKKSLEINLKNLGCEHPRVATVYNNIGITYYHLGLYNHALLNYEKSLLIQLKTLGLEHLDVALCYANIGVIYNKRSEYDHALIYNEKSLSIRLKTLGSQHPDTAISYNNIGGVYLDKGEYKKAIQYYKRCQKILLQNFGLEHPDVAQAYENIGSANYRIGEYDKAIELYAKSLKIKLKIYGPNHFFIGDCYYAIGNIKMKSENYLGAIKAFESGFKIDNQGHYPFKIAKCYEALGESQVGLQCFIESAEIRKDHLGLEDENTLESIDNARRLANELNLTALLPGWLKA